MKKLLKRIKLILEDVVERGEFTNDMPSPMALIEEIDLAIKKEPYNQALRILEALEEKTTVDYEGLFKQEVLNIIIKEL